MSNEINTVQDLWAKFGSGYWHNWSPTQCIVNNEIPKDVFNIAGSYSNTEAVKLDDISKREVITYVYHWSVTPTTLSFPATGGSQALNIDSYKTKYINGVSTGEVTQVGWSTQINGAGFSMSGKTITATPNISTSPRQGSWHFVQNESGWTADGTLVQTHLSLVILTVESHAVNMGAILDIKSNALIDTDITITVHLREYPQYSRSDVMNSGTNSVRTAITPGNPLDGNPVIDSVSPQHSNTQLYSF